MAYSPLRRTRDRKSDKKCRSQPNWLRRQARSNVSEEAFGDRSFSATSCATSCFGLRLARSKEPGKQGRQIAQATAASSDRVRSHRSGTPYRQTSAVPPTRGATECATELASAACVKRAEAIGSARDIRRGKAIRRIRPNRPHEREWARLAAFAPTEKLMTRGEDRGVREKQKWHVLRAIISSLTPHPASLTPILASPKPAPIPSSLPSLSAGCGRSRVQRAGLRPICPCF